MGYSAASLVRVSIFVFNIATVFAKMLPKRFAPGLTCFLRDDALALRQVLMRWLRVGLTVTAVASRAVAKRFSLSERLWVRGAPSLWCLTNMRILCSGIGISLRT